MKRSRPGPIRSTPSSAKRLADALYSVFTASGAKTLSELTEEKLKSAAAMLKTYKTSTARPAAW